MRAFRILLLSCTALSFLGAPALAQDRDDDRSRDVVIITAQTRSENIQEVPAAVTAIVGDALQDLGVTDVLDLNALSPSLRVKTDHKAANPNTASAVGVFARNVFDEMNISDIIPIEGLGFDLSAWARRVPLACSSATTADADE